MAQLMTHVMSLVISIFNEGIVGNIFDIRLDTSSFAFVVTFTSILMVSVIFHKLISLVLHEAK